MRMPYVSGYFYPADPERLFITVKTLLDSVKVENSAHAVIAPHAGYIYSGKVAAHSHAALKPSKHVVLLGPNHQGIGADVALSQQPWDAVLRVFEISERISNLHIPVDENAHAYEHSLEVQLPFLSITHPNSKIIPIVIKTFSLSVAQRVAEQLLSIWDEDMSLVVSSDFSHYVDLHTATKEDAKAISFILNKDPEGLAQAFVERQWSICGIMPILTSLYMAKALGWRPRLLTYDTSASANHDVERVVGYASVVFD